MLQGPNLDCQRALEHSLPAATIIELMFSAQSLRWLLLAGLVYYHDLHHRIDVFCPEPPLAAPVCPWLTMAALG